MSYVDSGFAELGYMEGQYPFEIGDSVIVEHFIVKNSETLEANIQNISTQLQAMIDSDGKDRVAMVYNPILKRSMMVKSGKSADVGGYVDPKQIQEIVDNTFANVQPAINQMKEIILSEVDSKVLEALHENINLSMKAVLPDGTVVADCSVNKVSDTEYEIDIPQSLQGMDYALRVSIEATPQEQA